MYNINIFKPVFLNDVTRLGRKTDGGYVINERVINKTKHVIGLGILSDWSFEDDFKKRNPDINLFCFDGTVGSLQFVNIRNFLFQIYVYLKINRYFKEKMNRFFYPFWISKTNTVDSENRVNINADGIFEIISKHSTLETNSCFLKMDIEGSEYDVLLDFLKHAKYINSICIEFHDLNTRWNEFELLINELKKDFYVSHAHGNNCQNLVEKTNIPIVLELTFLKKDLVDSSEIKENNMTYPLKGIDYRCARLRREILLKFD